MKSNLLIINAIRLTVLSSISLCGGCAAAGGLVVGASLDKMMSQVKEAEEKAIAGADLETVEAGGEVAVAIQNAKAAYSNSLDKTMNELSAADQQVINSLNSTVQQFTDHAYTDVHLIENEALGIVHTIPFSKNFPQLFNYEPHYVIPSSTATSSTALRFDGDFYDLPRTDYQVSATIEGNKFSSSAKSSDFAVIEIPDKAFTSASNTFKTDYLTVDIPYKSGFIFTKEAHTNFQLPLTILPKSPGKVVVTVTTPTSGTITKQVVSPEITNQDSSNDDIKDGGEHGDIAIHKWPADPGWQIIPSSVTYQVTWSQGDEGVGKDWWPGRNLSTLNEAVLTFNSEHHGGGTSGKVHFKIIFTEQQPTTQNVAADHQINLIWGQNNVLSVPTGSTWTGAYTRFDGKTQQFAGSYKDAFLTVTQAGPVINILANPTK